MLGGVAGGIAQTYGWDATLVRLAFVIAALLGIGIPAYVVAWIVIPPEDGDGEPERREGPAIIALLLLGVGVLLLGGRLLPRGHRIVDVMWAVALIGGGLFVLVMRSNSKQDTSESNVAFGPPAPDVRVRAARRAERRIDRTRRHGRGTSRERCCRCGRSRCFRGAERDDRECVDATRTLAVLAGGPAAPPSPPSPARATVPSSRP